MRVIYIAGLPRSGSTILQVLLAGDPQTVSLGEIFGAIRTERGESPFTPPWPCSCGRPRYECSFWGQVFPSKGATSIWDEYGRVLDQFRESYPNQVLIDASKSIEPVLSFYGRSDVDLHVVLIVRDVRGWIRSYQKHVKAAGQWRPVMDSYVASAYRWMLRNCLFMSRLRRSGVSWTLLSYDRLILDPERVTARLGKATGLAVPRQPSEVATVHELLGSPSLQLKRDEHLRLRYDESWKGDWRPVALAPFLLPVGLLNGWFRGVEERFDETSGSEPRE